MNAVYYSTIPMPGGCNMKKKLIALLLTLVLAANLCTMTAFAADSVRYGTLDEAAQDMRQYMKDRVTTFSVGFQYRPTSFDQEKMTQEVMAMIDQILDLAMAHTGVPDEGDYMRLMWGDWNMDYSFGYSGGGFAITLTFTFDYFTTAEQEREMDEAVNALLQELNLWDCTDYEKVYGIYEYLCTNVTYDNGGYTDNLKNTAYAALIQKAADCQGFATLFYRLCLELGVDARLVTGTSSRQTHSWNLVELDGLYYNADATWDAHLEASNLPWQCFLVSDGNLRDHIRGEDYASEEFYAAYPMGQENYVPDVPSAPDVPTEPEEPTAPSNPVVIDSGWSGNTLWELTGDGVLTFTGEGNMKNYAFTDIRPWEDYTDQITSVVIKEGVTAVGQCAFKDLTRLESVELPESGLTKIGIGAFYGCSSLKKIYIPDYIYTVWAYTFKGCSSLTDVRLPKQLTKIDMGAFENCTALEFIFIPGKTTIIGAWSFKGCTALDTVDIQWIDATEIREGAFKNCSALETVLFPESIQRLGDSAFYGIGAKTFTVPTTVTEIGGWCFARSNLKEIIFLSDAPDIGEGAFNKISLNAFYPGDNITWSSDVMEDYGGSVTWIPQ